MTDEGWWVISGTVLREALERVAAGELPGVVLAEIYANSDVEDVR